MSVPIPSVSRNTIKWFTFKIFMSIKHCEHDGRITHRFSYPNSATVNLYKFYLFFNFCTYSDVFKKN